jgi:hypothetical protein
LALQKAGRPTDVTFGSENQRHGKVRLGGDHAAYQRFQGARSGVGVVIKAAEMSDRLVLQAKHQAAGNAAAAPKIALGAMIEDREGLLLADGFRLGVKPVINHDHFAQRPGFF